MKQYGRIIASVITTCMVISICLVPTVNCLGSKPVIENHPQPGIWDYENQKNQPSKALVLELQHEKWQFTAAACMTPAFIDRFQSTPIFFDDGSEAISIEIPHDSKTVISFGSDISTATASMATTYWTKAEIVVTADTYEQVLWLIATASFLSAPILVNPSSSTLEELGTKCAVVVGDEEPDVDEVINLETKEEIWQFQLELFDTKGQVCDYVILTNPSDTDDSLNSNIKWPYLSLASAPLAAYRKAIIQTGDWTVNKSKIESLEMAIEKDDSLYNEMKPYFDQVKQDSYSVEKFLLNNSHTPEYMAVVGGPYAIPNYFYDILVTYKYPINNPQVTVYPSTIGAYATLQESVPNDSYIKEDLAAGRIMTSSLYDASKQLMKTFFYREFLPDGMYHSYTPINWEKTASVVDGHRLNQPEPYSLIWDPDIPYHPANYVKEVFLNGSFDTTYFLVRNESDPYDQNKTIFGIMEEVTNTSLLQFLPHGGKTTLRIEIGIDPISGDGESTHLKASDVRNLHFKAPTIVYTTCCKGANPFMLDEGLATTDFVISAFIHAGCVAYIATPEIQSTCFWREAPLGISTQQTIFTWENLLDSNIPIGKALRDAKWEAREWAIDKWPDENDVNGTFEIDCIIYNLFGDPALEPYKPDVSFDSKKDMNVQISYEDVRTKETLKVSIELSSFDSGEAISDADVTITFNGKTKTGYTASFDVPEEKGNYKLLVSVEKSGYNDLTAKYSVYVEEAEGEDNTWLLVGIIIIIIIIIAIVLAVRARKKS